MSFKLEMKMFLMALSQGPMIEEAGTGTRSARDSPSFPFTIAFNVDIRCTHSYSLNHPLFTIASIRVAHILGL